MDAHIHLAMELPRLHFIAGHPAGSQSLHCCTPFPCIHESDLASQDGVKEQFGSEIQMILPLLQPHTQLTMAWYFNDVTVPGANASLPLANDLINSIKY